ncbi:MAG: glycosyl transferase family 4 [Rhodanobacter sp.]
MSVLALIGWPLAALAMSLALVRAAIGYTRRHGMLDQPGRRRSHDVPTPRGGGIGIVLAVMVCAPAALITASPAWSHLIAVTLAGALALVALVGWWDDRRSLPVLPRLAAQAIAVAALSLVLVHGQVSSAWLLLLLPLGVWSINLHNFMDGIDGLLALQGMFVAVALGVLAWSVGQAALAAATAVLALATFGFWIFNRPPARIFMGDVGSGSMGLLIFAFGAMLWRVDTSMVWPILIVSSAFNVDAGLTLATRMLRGRRWYTAHREHLYQWLVRRGVTHARTGAAYLGWNVLVAAPMAWLASVRPTAALATCMFTHFFAAGLWLLLKRRLARRHPLKVRHVTA